jgi:hypothetical protein
MSKIRKIEYFEDQLKVSATGREVLQLIRQHGDEIMYLINKNRPTMVCWQRHHGPKFVKSFVDSGFEDDATFIKSVDGVSMETLILYMAEVLQDYGSAVLKQQIGKYAPVVLQMARETRSLKEIIYKINNIQNIQQYA